jgi:hypothetical protein
MALLSECMRNFYDNGDSSLDNDFGKRGESWVVGISYYLFESSGLLWIIYTQLIIS